MDTMQLDIQLLHNYIVRSQIYIQYYWYLYNTVIYLCGIQGYTFSSHVLFLQIYIKINYFNDSGHITNPQDLDQFVLTSEDGSYYCGICSQAANQKSNLKKHIESKHFPNLFSYQCPECPHVVGTKKALDRHKERIHPKSKFV